jgi:hypothetical protein
MKRISLVAALLGAIVLAFAGIASATTVPGTSGNTSPGGYTGKGTVVTHYVATYADPVFGQVSCTGVNQVKKSAPMQDSFTCTSTQGGLTGVTPGQVINWGPNMWISDFDGIHYDSSFTATVSADGMSYTGVAIY